MKKNSTKWLVLASTVVCLVSATSAFLFLRTKDPEYAEKSFANAVSLQNWEAVYDLHYQQEWKNHRISKKQFSKFMTCIASRFPEGALSDYALIETATSNPDDMDSPTHHRAMIQFPRLTSYRLGSPLQFHCLTARTSEGWIVPVAELPFLLSECVTKDRNERNNLLNQCLIEADIKFYPMHNVSLSRAELDRHLKGEIDYESVFVNRR